MITIAVDAMGGDQAPRTEVEGSVLAAREFGVRVLLVGQPSRVEAGTGALFAAGAGGRDRAGQRSDRHDRLTRPRRSARRKTARSTWPRDWCETERPRRW